MFGNIIKWTLGLVIWTYLELAKIMNTQKTIKSNRCLQRKEHKAITVFCFRIVGNGQSDNPQ